MNDLTTKLKGDIGVSQVIAHLNKQGIYCSLPISEHLPFDIIAISSNYELSRLSVKYCTMHQNGSIAIPLKTVSHNAQGYNIKRVNFDNIDAFAVYCPNNDSVYFISVKSIYKNNSEKRHNAVFALRIDPVSEKFQGNFKAIRWARDFTDASVIFNKTQQSI